MLAFSHNPDDFVDWIWVVLTFAIVLAVLGVLIAVGVRWLHVRRRAARENSRSRDRSGRPHRATTTRR